MLLAGSAELVVVGYNADDSFLAAEAKVGRTKPAFDVVVSLLLQAALATAWAVDQILLLLRNKIKHTIHSSLALVFIK